MFFSFKNKFNCFLKYIATLFVSIIRNVYLLLPVGIEIKRKWAEKIIYASPLIKKYLKFNERNLGFSYNDKISFSTKNTSKKILIIEQRIPTPDRTSSSVRLQAMLDLIIDEGWNITFISNATPDHYHWIFVDVKSDIIKYEESLKSKNIEFFYGKESAINLLKDRGHEFQKVILIYPEIMSEYAPLVRFYMPGAELIYDTVDIHFLRFEREYKLNKTNQLKKRVEEYKKMELSNFQIADQIIAITKKEYDDIKKLAGAKSILIIPNIHEIHSEIDIPDFSLRKNLLFIGHYLHNPNSDAMLYFVKEIFPLIKKSIPGIKLIMIGSSITNEIKKLANKDIEAVGFVENLDPYLNDARVFVAPLRFGAGMKGKIGQALACGLPVVTTSIGAEGMGLQNEKNILEANTPSSFAKRVVQLYNTPTLWRKLSLNGSRHIDKFYSKKTCKQFIRKMLEH